MAGNYRAAMVDSSWFNRPKGGRKFHAVINGFALCSHQPTTDFTERTLADTVADRMPTCGRQPCKHIFENSEAFS